MAIVRHKNQVMAGRPIISKVVEHGGTVYVCGMLPEPVGDITAQTRQVLERIDEALRLAGTDKSKLLTAQVWLSDMRLFEAHNAVSTNGSIPTMHRYAPACAPISLRMCLVETW